MAVKIDTVIKGTCGTGERQKDSSSVAESGCAAHVCLKAEQRLQSLLARLLREPGAQNHLRSPTLLPRGPPCPSAGAINV